MATESPSHELEWIVGCWENESGAAREVWAQEVDLLLGYSVDIKMDKVEFFEHMRIEQSKNGYDFIVSPFGREWVTFTQKERGDRRISFENTENDYPQLIRYERVGDKLNAVISALDGSNPTPFNKMSCR